MPAKVIERLEEELRQLKETQDKAMSLAIYVGMTAAEARAVDERRKRIYELYEELLSLRKEVYRNANPHASSSL